MMRRGIAFLFMLAAGVLVAGASTASATTYVSLTFDDGNADQMPAVQMLADHGMDGTFYIITGRVGDTGQGYMTWDQVQSVYDHGNEIGGHTVTHPELPELTEEEQREEICGGRDALLAKGFPQVSFAYPHGDHDATTEALVQECGYLSGRRVGGLDDPEEPKADTIPPQDQWLVRSRKSVKSGNTPSEIEGWITAAEAQDAGNGNADAWITLIFHHLCDPDECADLEYITPQDFESVLDWLEPREPATRVETMAKVMDPSPPSSEIRCNGATCSSNSYADPVSVTLSATDAGRSTGASGVKDIRYTTDESNPTGSSPVYAGPIGVAATTTIKFRATDNAGNTETVHSQAIGISSSPGGGPGGSTAGKLGAFSSFKRFPNGTGKLTLEVTGPGELGVIDGSAKATMNRKRRINRISRTVTQGGRVTLKIRPSKRGRRVLRRKGKLAVPVRITFTPDTGSPMARTLKLKLRLRGSLKR